MATQNVAHQELLLSPPEPNRMQCNGPGDPMQQGEFNPVRGSQLVRPQALIFEGGGTKGIHYAGALRCLEDAGLLQGIRLFAGTSAGAQTAALLAFGYTGAEMEEMMLNTPWHNLLDGAGGLCGCCRGSCRLRSSHGFYLGEFLEDYLDQRFAEKRPSLGRKCTFQELYMEKGTELRLGACNMTTQRFEFLDRRSHPDLPVSEAVRASSSIPLVFVPTQIGNGIYVDGMFQGNLPVSAFPNKRVLAFHLSSELTPARRPNSLRGFIGAILDMLMSSAQRKHGLNFLSFADSPRQAVNEHLEILTIDCVTGASMETRLSQAQINSMLEAGRASATEYLQERHNTASFTLSSDRSPSKDDLGVSDALQVIKTALETMPNEQGRAALQTLERELAQSEQRQNGL